MGSAVADQPAPESTATSARGRWGRTPLVFVVAALVVAVDQATKSWVVSQLGDGRNRHVIGSLQLGLHYNGGSAFSLFQGLGPYLGVLAVVVVIVLAITGRSTRSAGAAIVIGLLIGGAFGNLLDRAFRSSPGHTGFMHGAVVDFIDLQWWPVFNVADSAIVVGAILLAVGSVMADVKARHPKQSTEGTT